MAILSHIPPQQEAFYPTLHRYCATLADDALNLPAERREALEQVADYVVACSAENKPARLLFICTHNSRRSQLGQAWAMAAAAWYGIEGVEVYSGGTEVSACNARTVEALRRAGFEVTRVGGTDDNPMYHASCSAQGPQTTLYSKVYDTPEHPDRDFCAVLVCSQAEEACPMVQGASLRVYHGYEDPKQADGLAEEAEVYDTRSLQIALEMFYAMGRVLEKLR